MDFWKEYLHIITYGLSDVVGSIGNAAVNASGLNNGLDQSKYDFTYRVFPENLGDEENSHYMILNINLPVSASLFSGLPGTDLVGSTEFSKVDTLRISEMTSGAGGVVGAFLGGTGGGGTFGRTASRRIASSIALHMPNGGLVFTDDNKYEEVSMTSMAGSAIASGIGIASKAADKSGMFSNLGTSIWNAVTGAVTNVAKISGMPINPRVEVIFATRPQRQWMFEVLLAPRTATEAETIREIIRTIRYYAAPEITAAGFAFIPPAEFDITFYRNGVENTYLPRINTCVLEKIDIDFAPADGKYATFKNGAPVAVRLSMGFRELEITHKARVYQGF